MSAWVRLARWDAFSNPMKQNTTDTDTVERITYTGQEAAAALGVSGTTLWRWEKRGLIKPVPGIRLKLFSVAELKRFASASRREAA